MCTYCLVFEILRQVIICCASFQASSQLIKTSCRIEELDGDEEDKEKEKEQDRKEDNEGMSKESTKNEENSQKLIRQSSPRKFTTEENPSNLKGGTDTPFQLLPSEKQPYADSDGGQAAINLPHQKKIMVVGSSSFQEEYPKENPSRPQVVHASVTDSQKAAAYVRWKGNMLQDGQALKPEKIVLETKQVTASWSCCINSCCCCCSAVNVSKSRCCWLG